jgi:hypothetical protein
MSNMYSPIPKNHPGNTKFLIVCGQFVTGATHHH